MRTRNPSHDPLRWMGRSLALAAVAAVAGAAALAQAGSEQVSADADATKPFVVKIHADWCGTCTRLDPTMAALQKKVGANARFVVLDVTDKQTLADSSAEAKRLGLSAFFDENKGRTGTVGVLDGASREPVVVLRGEMDLAPYEAAIQKAGESPS